MKLFLYLFGMAGAGLLGYFAEPDLRFQLTGMMPSGARSGIGQAPPGASVIDLSSITAEQLPPRVLINSDVKVTDSASGIVMLIQAGNRVKLIRIEGTTAVVSPGDGPYLGSLPVSETDLLQQLAANPPSIPAPPPVTPAPPIGGDSEEPSLMQTPPPVPEPAPIAEPPAPTPAPETATAPPEPAPAPAPAPAMEETTPAPAVAAADSGAPVDTVAVMQESIKSAQIKEFTPDQVLEWNAGPDEIVDGENYKTGIASYKTETIFGVKTIQAKALIKDGKVQRWIWPKSGMEIK